MADIFLIAIGMYILYKVLFEFIVPVYKTSTHVREQFKNMRNAQGKADDARQQQKAAPKKEQRDSSMGEYIDFEELK
jgi:hypothetical protein